MAANTQTVKPNGGHAVIASLARFSTIILGKAHAVVKVIQTGRMLSTLSNMNDSQLAQLGISRSEIPEYAEKLLADD